jgi:predicted Zn-dependent protease
MRRVRAAALLLAAALTSACASLGAPRPAASVSIEVQERTLRTRIKVLDDAATAELMARVTETLLTDEERAAGAREVVVVRDPTMSAFVLPGGRVYVHTGLLARLENEAQLATVLGRALTLARAGGALESRARTGSAEDVFLAMPATLATTLAGDELSGAVLSPVAEVVFGHRLATPYVAAVTGYGPELEADADAGALRRVVRAGYDPKQAPRAFERLRRDARLGGPIERFFLGRESVLAERVEGLSRLVSRDYVLAAALTDTVTTTDEFEQAMAVVARENARLEMRIGRFRQAQEQLDRAVAIWPMDPLTHLSLGDLYRLRAQRARGAADRDELARRALASYERCASLDPDIIDVARQIGLLYYQQGRFEQAREAFSRYVSRSPDAPDAPRVQEYLTALGGR